MGTQNDESYYPRFIDRAGFCGTCRGLGRIADDWCRPCAGTGRNALDSMGALVEAVSAASAEIYALRAAALKASLAFRGLLPYLPRFPAETEQRVRQALHALEGVARG